MPTLRIASYNLRAFRDDRRAAAAVVRAIDPDVLLLQEMPRIPLTSYRIADFARSTGLLWSGRTRRFAGTSIMTSLRVLATDSIDHKLPVRDRWGTREGDPRSYTSTQVRPPGGPVLTLASVHLSLLAPERREHVQQVLAELHTAHPGSALVVGGDLNESTDGAAWQLLGQQLEAATPDRPTFPSSRPRRRIDAIFLSSELPVVNGAKVDLDPTLLRAATDHLPVWVDVEL